MIINLNDNILVKLNDRGKDIFYHQFDKILHEFPESGIKRHMPVVDENGYTEFQIWRFMELYGEHIGMGNLPILENYNVIYKKPYDFCSDEELEEASKQLTNCLDSLGNLSDGILGLVLYWLWKTQDENGNTPIEKISMEFKDYFKRFEIKEPRTVKYAGSKEGSEESDILNNGCWSRLKDALSDIESNEKEKSYFKVEGAKMVVEPKDYDLCKEECDYHFEECSNGHKNIIFTLNGKIKEDTGISRIQIRLDKCNLEEVVDAEWKEKNSHTRYCSACGFEETHWRTDEYKRCPNCGAKIRKSKKYLEDYITVC